MHGSGLAIQFCSLTLVSLCDSAPQRSWRQDEFCALGQVHRLQCRDYLAVGGEVADSEELFCYAHPLLLLNLINFQGATFDLPDHAMEVDDVSFCLVEVFVAYEQ